VLSRTAESDVGTIPSEKPAWGSLRSGQVAEKTLAERRARSTCLEFALPAPFFAPVHICGDLLCRWRGVRLLARWEWAHSVSAGLVSRLLVDVE